jgi:hypothetical protein
MNFQGREIIWPVVGQAFLASPVLGQGLGVSTHYVVTTIDPAGGAVVHNEYLRLAADTGLIGLTLFTTAMIIWLVAAVRGGRAPGLVREFAVPAVAGMVAWAVIALTDNPFDYYAQFTQYIAFLVAATVALSDGEVEGGEVEGRVGVIDMHNHVIPGVDDGARDVPEAVAALQRLADAGATAVLTTPHFQAIPDPPPGKSRPRGWRSWTAAGSCCSRRRTGRPWTCSAVSRSCWTCPSPPSTTSASGSPAARSCWWSSPT